MEEIKVVYVSGYYVDKLHVSAEEHIIKREPFFVYCSAYSEKLIAIPEFGFTGQGHGEASHGTTKIRFFDLNLNKVELYDHTTLVIRQET